jgi:hypothetical protein
MPTIHTYIDIHTSHVYTLTCIHNVQIPELHDMPTIHTYIDIHTYIHSYIDIHTSHVYTLTCIHNVQIPELHDMPTLLSIIDGFRLGRLCAFFREMEPYAQVMLIHTCVLHACVHTHVHFCLHIPF